MKAKKLLSHFRKTVEWSLVASIAASGFSIFYVSRYLSLINACLLVLLLVFFYYRESAERVVYKKSYLSLVSLIVLWLFHSSDSLFFDIILSLVATASFVLWLLIERFLARAREDLLFLLHTILVYFSFLFALVSQNIFASMVAGLIFYLVFWEGFTFLGTPWMKRVRLSGAVSGFILFEFSLIALWLPLDAIGLAGLLTFTGVILRNLFSAHFSGFLSPRYAISQVGILIFFFLFIFTFGRWSI